MTQRKGSKKKAPQPQVQLFAFPTKTAAKSFVSEVRARGLEAVTTVKPVNKEYLVAVRAP